MAALNSTSITVLVGNGLELLLNGLVATIVGPIMFAPEAVTKLCATQPENFPMDSYL
jgi:hypothetical protein